MSALEGHYDVVQILLSHGADIDSKDADGRSTLYVLALDNRLAMSKYFIQQGADVETRDLEVNVLHFTFTCLMKFSLIGPYSIACIFLAGPY